MYLLPGRFFFFGGEGSTTSLFCILRPFVDFLIFARFMYLLFARACMNYLPTWFCIYSLSDFLVSTPCRIFFFLLYFFICLTRVCCICSQILHLLLARVSHRSPPARLSLSPPCRIVYLLPARLSSICFPLELHAFTPFRSSQAEHPAPEYHRATCQASLAVAVAILIPLRLPRPCTFVVVVDVSTSVAMGSLL